MSEASVPVSDNLGRLLSTRAEKISKGRYIPPIIRGANVALITFAILAILSVLSGFYIDASYHADFWPAVVHFLATLLEALAGGWIATTAALWFACDKGVGGRMGVHSLVDFDGNRAIYMHDNSSGEQGKHVEVFEILCEGQLVDKFFKGNGPVFAHPVIEQDEVRKLNDQYRETGIRPQLPTNVRWHGTTRWGTTYLHAADYHPTLLGNEYSIVPDDMRRFIMEKWPHLTAGAIVNLAWKRLPPEKEVDTSYRESGMEYEIASLKAQKHALAKTNEGLLDLVEDNAQRTVGENV